LTTVLAFALVISVLVLVHELGHHLMAKWFGVPVEVFSVGFGPKLVGICCGGTEYRLSIIPFGGYVKMAGTSMAGRDTTPNGFDSRSPWQRFLILLAGPAMNVGFALVLATVALWCGIEFPAYRSSAAVVGSVVEESAAQRAGLEAGDHIVAVSGRAVSSWSGVDSQIAARSNQSIPVTVRRADAEITFTLAAQSNASGLALGILPDANPVVRSVSRSGAARRAGLRVGDTVLAINGKQTNVTTDVEAAVVQLEGRPVTLAIVRDGQEGTVTIEAGAGSFGAQAVIPTALFRPEPLDAVVLGTRAITRSSVNILKTIGGLMTGDLSASHLVGPVGLAQIAGESSRLGWRALLAVMALISLNLGLCNLLPIPILDGGHMVMLAVEGICRRDVPFRVRKVLVGAGAVAMLLLLVTTFYNDLGRLGWL